MVVVAVAVVGIPFRRFEAIARGKIFGSIGCFGRRGSGS
jgi:hypothetical protein